MSARSVLRKRIIRLEARQIELDRQAEFSRALAKLQSVPDDLSGDLCECGKPLAQHPKLPKPPLLRSWKAVKMDDTPSIWGKRGTFTEAQRAAHMRTRDRLRGSGEQPVIVSRSIQRLRLT